VGNLDTSSLEYMCCFNAPVQGVSQTKILVFPTKDGRQVTLYQNKVGVVGGGRGTKAEDEKKKADIVAQQEKAKYENAMILPCPLKTGHKVQLLDLSKDNFSFERVENFFPKKPATRSRGVLAGIDKSHQSHLEVVEIGEYFVSIAENFGDLKRIDPSVFKVSDNIQNVFSKHYVDGFGFIICAFNPNKKVEGGHPIGYVHDLLPDGKMFVPCRHEHGAYSTKAQEHFDHVIYSVNTKKGTDTGDTRDEILQANPSWSIIEGVTENAALTSDLLAPLYPEKITALRRRRIDGFFKNDDLEFSLAA